MIFKPEIAPTPEDEKNAAYWFIFRENQILLINSTELPQIPLLKGESIWEQITGRRFLGYWDGCPCFAANWGTRNIPADWENYNIRELFGKIDDRIYRLIGRAFHFMYWEQNNQYCGRCGAPTANSPIEYAKICSKCGWTIYPRIAPAIIVAVVKGDQILLAQAKNSRTGFYGVIAGFVEPGETLEETVAREISEEVGITVKNIRYFGSQPWPFPDSLMLGFTAEWADGEIVVDDKEIGAAGWFRAEEIPNIPG
jgi:NAD+ diphosphatase